MKQHTYNGTPQQAIEAIQTFMVGKHGYQVEQRSETSVTFVKKTPRGAMLTLGILLTAVVTFGLALLLLLVFKGTEKRATLIATDNTDGGSLLTVSADSLEPRILLADYVQNSLVHGSQEQALHTSQINTSEQLRVFSGRLEVRTGWQSDHVARTLELAHVGDVTLEGGKLTVFDSSGDVFASGMPMRAKKLMDNIRQAEQRVAAS